MSGTRVLRGVALTLVLGLAATGCAEDSSPTTDSVEVAPVVGGNAPQVEQRTGAALLRNLPVRPTGEIQVDGADNPLTAAVVGRFNAEQAATVERRHGGEEQAFRRLCAGQIDIVDSARPISQEEWEGCRVLGLDVVQLQVAADAVVAAIRGETDTGGDCLTTDQVRDVFRAGSPITTWAQLGLDDVPLEAGGAAPGDSGFEFFGRYVLDAPEPALTNWRSDYAAFEEDDDVRAWVVGHDNDKRLAARWVDVDRRHAQLREELKLAWGVWHDADAEVDAAVREQVKGVRDGRTPAARHRDDVRVSNAYFARSDAVVTRNEIKVRFDRVHERWERVRAARRAVDATIGNVAYFRFSYYGVYEQLLRPFEVTLPDGERNCVFPSQQTVLSGTYPLARRLLLTTTTRSLERRGVSDFLRYYVGRSQRLAEEATLVPLPDDDVERQLRWLEGDEEPPVLAPGNDGTTAVPTPPVADDPAVRPAR